MVFRWACAALLAPLLPALVIIAYCTVAGATVGRAPGDVTLIILIAVGVFSVPASWICMALFLTFFQRRGIRSLMAYVGAAAGCALFFSLIFPPAIFLTVPAAALVGLGVWCALWLGRRQPGDPADPHRWSLRPLLPETD